MQKELDKGDRRFWKPKDGRNRIRLMPPWEGSDVFFVKAGFHYNVGDDDKFFACPLVGEARDTCWICEKVEELRKGDEDDQAESKAMRVNRKYLMSVVDLEEPKDGPQVWQCGSRAFKEVLSYFRDPDYGDITDLEEGFDLTVTKKGSGMKTEYQVRAARKPTPFPTDDMPDDAEDWLDELPDLSTSTEYATDAEMEAAYDGVASSGKSREDDDEPRRGRNKRREDDDDDDDEEDEKPARGRGRRAAPASSSSRASRRTKKADDSPSFPDEDDDDDEDDDEDEDDEDEDEDADEDDDEEDEKPARGRTRRASGRASKADKKADKKDTKSEKSDKKAKSEKSDKASTRSGRKSPSEAQSKRLRRALRD